MNIFIKCFTFILLSFTILGCNGQILNHYASRPDDPIDGTFGNRRFNKDDVKYVQGNLNYLTDRKKRNDNVYYASADYYNRLNYDIANDYITNYKKYLKVDSKELENGLKNNQYGVKGKDLLKKMETGSLTLYPVQKNVDEIQKLKDQENKIAFPDYMDEYLDVYIDNTDKEKNKKMNSYNNSITIAFDTTTRDDYIDKYLGWNGDYAEKKKIKYREKPLNN